MPENNFSHLKEAVIDKGLCTSCGTCVGVCPVGCIDFDYETEEPVQTDECAGCGRCFQVCPGAEIPLLEMERRFLGETRTEANEYIGVHKKLLKGYSADPSMRKNSASGGLATALLLYALEKDMINGAILTTMDEKRPWRTKPFLARTPEDIIGCAKSKYAICPTNKALEDVKQGDRLAVVGLPCHIHGIRKMQLCDDLSGLAGKIVLVMGLYCGANSSHLITEHIIKEFSDVELDQISRFEYRGGKSSQDMMIYTKDGREITIANAERSGISQWLFKDRCLMCCDWTAEVTDISLGDIFDPSIKKGWRKIPEWNSVVVRTETGLDLVEKAAKDEVIEVSPLEEEALYGNIGLESKKHGGVYHLMERKKHGWPVPSYGFEFSWKPLKRRDYPIPE